MAKSLVKRCLNRFLNIVARVSPGCRSWRPMLHRWRGVKVGKDVFIGDDVFIDGEYPEMIEIQDGAAISMRAMIIAHSMGPGKVLIGRRAFVGPHAIILCNGGKELRIGEGAVVSAGCVISRSVDAGAVVVPAPNKVVGIATVPMSQASTLEEFWSGLRPLPSALSKSSGTQNPPSAPSVDERRASAC